MPSNLIDIDAWSAGCHACLVNSIEVDRLDSFLDTFSHVFVVGRI
jgi:hypothetical protein